MFRMNYGMFFICLFLNKQFTGFYFALLISVCYTVTATVLTAWIFTCILLNYLVRRNTPAAAADPEAQHGASPAAPCLVRHFSFVKDAVFCIYTFLAFLFLLRTTNDVEFSKLIFTNK